MSEPPPPGERPTSSGPSQESMVRGDLLYEAIARNFADPHFALVKAETLSTVLREVPIFSRLDEGELRKVAGRTRVARISAGQVIVREGMTSEALYVLLTGCFLAGSSIAVDPCHRLREQRWARALFGRGS